MKDVKDYIQITKFTENKFNRPKTAIEEVSSQVFKAAINGLLTHKEELNQESVVNTVVTVLTTLIVNLIRYGFDKQTDKEQMIALNTIITGTTIASKNMLRMVHNGEFK